MIKVEYPDGAVYAILDDQGKVKALVTDAGNGTVVTASAPVPGSALQQWLAEFARCLQSIRLFVLRNGGFAADERRARNKSQL